MSKNIHIFRVRKGTDYLTISKTPINDPALSVGALGVLVYLLSKPDDWIVYNAQIQKRFGIGRKQLDRIIRELKKAGYIQRQRYHNGHKFQWYTNIYEHPQLSQNGTIAMVPKGNRTKGDNILSNDIHGDDEKNKNLFWIDEPTKSQLLNSETTTQNLTVAWLKWYQNGREAPRGIENPIGWAITQIEQGKKPPEKKQTAWYTQEEEQCIMR